MQKKLDSVIHKLILVAQEKYQEIIKAVTKYAHSSACWSRLVFFPRLLPLHCLSQLSEAGKEEMLMFALGDDWS